VDRFRRIPPGARRAAAALPALAALLAAGTAVSAEEAPFGAELVTDALSFPTFAAAPPCPAAPCDPRLFVAELGGRIAVVEADGSVRAEPFLDISGSVSTGGSEGGLLSFAFPPGFSFAADDVLYVYYTAPVGEDGLESRVSRFGLDDAEPAERADPTDEDILFAVAQPAANHNGGTIAFRDGLLYLGLGDGGGAFDPDDRAQDPNSPLGKMLRFDPAGAPPWTPEVWASGLRNPFRFSFDRATGDLYIADVGQNQLEEIDVEPADAPGGRNYGWDVLEGTACLGPEPPSEPACDDPGLTPPVFEYAQLGGSCGDGGSGSVTGGVVYRGDAIPSLQGRYLFADFCTDEIRSLLWDGAGGVSGDVLDHTDALALQSGPLAGIVAFGEDASGELLIVGSGGELVRVVPGPGAAAAAAAVAGALAALARRRAGRLVGGRRLG